MRFFLGLPIIGILLLLSSAGQAAERKFSIFGFDDIRIGNGVDVVLTSGKGPSARAEGPTREILDRVSLQRNGKQLVVSVRPKSLDRNNYAEDAPVTLYLSSFAIQNVSHLGSGLVTLDKLSGRTPKVRLGGFGSLRIDAVEADRLDVAMTGGGQLMMTGQADAARLELQGASIFASPDLKVKQLTLIHRGPASSHLAVEREANVSNFGTGRIQIDGRPNCTVRTDGSAEIICNPDR
ncbi:GIN domain-containing protein [Parasphingorhabdus sp.]|uniref:GIN domain-containing protein n=1 Tax=Parasphingorhabdus sp. TaxID=2709688 RepID=UPI003593340D